ncbi:hypothetical protein [Reyranella soli]|uniref:Uncharacterized protein n=1 Tax=Reyranella soli TaxID=1230389 RepID=A0A512NT61_9HYPH|nr:hypothetical protein [Reyranella soli]GEP62147.1 hypothetical protein RSO01_93130 [Reyranella soli]
MARRGFWRTLVLLVGLSLFATVPAQAQNGLQRFEKEIKPQLEFKSLTYDKAAPLGDKGFTLSNVVAVVPASVTGGKDSTVKIEKVTVEEIDFDRMKDSGKKDEIPLFAKLKIEGMTGDDDLSGMLESFGIPKAPVDLALDYRLNAADKVLTISKLEMGLQGQGTLSLSLVLDGVSDKASEAAGAKDTASLRSASLVYTDVGLLSQLVPAVAKQQGMAADAMVAMAVAPIGAFATGKGPGTVKALDALASFIADWKKPKGPITISVTPAKSASINDLDKIEQPNALTDIFGLKIEYAGTRAGAAGGVAPSTGGQSAAAAAPPADKTMTGAEAWLTIIGNTVTGKVDGEVIFEHYRKDGTLALLEGSEITKGKWSLEGERVCFKYPDEDKDCQTITRTGDEVTFKRKDKSGYKLKVLQGNPKNL